jgi:hypothetical protein
MFTRTFSVGRNHARRAVSLVLALGLVLGALAFMGCPMEEDTFVDDHKLNTGLIGTWKGSGTYPGEDGTEVSWTDTYTITSGSGDILGTIAHPDGWTWQDANIEYVYNFSDSAGCLIVKYTDSSNNGKYNAVYFKDLSSGSVLLGEAYDTSIIYPADTDSSVGTLEEAKTRFAPENAEAYGGGSGQTGTPQQKQQL